VDGEAVLVTAQVEGQIAAINQQRQANTITNVVSKDRIEELPDVNAAESIGRLPGISLQRSGGEANKVVIRGLSPKYNTVTVNGVRMPSTDSQNRSVDLSLVSSNMLDGITVMKALTPDKDADALGGSIDLKLRTADAGFQSDVMYQGGYNQLRDTYNNYKLNASAGSRFWKDRIGVIANVNADRYNRSGDRFNAGYSGFLVGEERIPIPNQITVSENSLTRERLGGSIVADVKLPNGKITFNSIYNKLTNDGLNRSNEMAYGSDEHRYTMSDNYNETFINANGLSVEQDFEWLKYDVTLSLNQSESENPLNYSYEFRQFPVTDRSTPTAELTPEIIPSLFRDDSTQTFLFSLSSSQRLTLEDEATAQFNIQVPFSLGDKVSGYFKTGAKYRKLTRSNDQTSESTGNTPYYGGGRQLRTLIAETYPEYGIDPAGKIPIAVFLDNYTPRDFLSGRYSLGYTIRPDFTKEVFQLVNSNGYTFFSRNGSLGSDYEGDETFTAAYAMAEFKIGKMITFMPGFRIEHEETDYSAKYSGASSPAAGIPLEEITYRDTTAQRSDQVFLPMIHAQFSPIDNLQLRLAYTETISRPDFRQFAPITYYDPTGNWANAPNINLRSSKAKNYDVSLSVYQNHIGFLTVSGFYKEIEDLIWGVEFNLIEGQNILPDLYIEEAGNTAPSVYTSINNPNLATIKGIEIDWQTNFWYLPSFLKGLVLNVNYTHLTSDTEIPTYRLEQVPIVPRPRRPPFTTSVLVDTTISSTLPDQPNDILNVSLGYDYKGFSTRLSFFYQVGSLAGKGGAQFETYDDTYIDDYFRIDLSIKQELPLGFQLFANLNNLNAEGDRRYQSPVYRYSTNEQYYGFTMDVGVRYRFK
jgi:TonB-dependent receptor